LLLGSFNVCACCSNTAVAGLDELEKMIAATGVVLHMTFSSSHAHEREHKLCLQQVVHEEVEEMQTLQKKLALALTWAAEPITEVVWGVHALGGVGNPAVDRLPMQSHAANPRTKKYKTLCLQ